MREFVLANVRYWIREFHLDGSRVDATQSIVDDSTGTSCSTSIEPHARLLAERGILIIAENEPQHAQTDACRRKRAATSSTARWNDDFHHTAMVRLTGRSEAYYTDYRGTAEEFMACARWGYLYQGQRYSWQRIRAARRHSIWTPWRFVNYLQNHDQSPIPRPASESTS